MQIAGVDSKMTTVAPTKTTSSSLNSIDYDDFPPFQVYQIVKTASYQTIKDIAPQFNAVQIEFIADHMHDKSKVAAMTEAWNKAHKGEKPKQINLSGLAAFIKT